MKKDGGKKRVKNKNIFSSKNLLIGFVAIVILLLLFNYTYTFSKRNLDIFRDSELGELYQSVGSGSNVYESCNENTFTMINAFEADSVEDFLEEALRTYKDENKPISDETSADMQDKNELEDFKDILNKILTDAGNGDRTILERDEMQKLLEAYSMYQPPEGEGDPVLDTQKPYVEAWYVEYDPEGSPTTVERIPLDEDAKFPFHTSVNQDIGVIIPTGGGMYSVYKLDWKSAFEPPFLGRTLTDYYPKWKLNGIYPGTFSKEQAVFNLEKPINAANAKVFQLIGGNPGAYTYDIIEAINWAIDPDLNPATDDGADVINMSLGGTGTDPAMDAAVKAAVNAGVTVVVSAGNCGNGCPSSDCGSFRGVTFPGNIAESLTVGAVDDSNAVACFSSGENVMTTVAR